MLAEERRKQLDGIVQQMTTNGESDNDIQFVVNDFKTKYDTKPAAPQETGFTADLQNVGREFIEGISNPKPSSIRDMAPALVGPAFNVAKQTGRAAGGALMAGVKAMAPAVMGSLKQANPIAHGVIEGGLDAGKMVLGSLRGNPVVDAGTSIFNALPEGKRNDIEGILDIANLAGIAPLAKPTMMAGREAVNIAKDAGQLTGQVVKKGIGKALPKNAPQSLIESGVKWSTTLAPETRRGLTRTMLDEKLTPNPKGYDKLMSNIDGIDKQVKSALKPYADTPIDAQSIVKRTNDVRNKAANSFDAAGETAKVDSVVSNFLDNWEGKLTVGNAQTIKSDIYRQMNKHYAAMDRGGMPIYTDGEVNAMKQIARGLKEEIETIAKDAPIKNLNARETRLWKLEPHLRRAVGRIENHNILSLDDALAAGVGTTIGGFTGGPVGAAIGAAAGGAAKRALGHPVTKAKLATLIDGMQKGEIGIIPRSETGKAILGKLSGKGMPIVENPPAPGMELGPVRSGRTVGQPYGPAAPTLIQRKQLPAGQGFELNGPAYAPDVIDANFTATSRPIPQTPQLVAPETIQGQLRLPAGQGFELVDQPTIAKPQIGKLVEQPKQDVFGSGLRAARERQTAQAIAKGKEAENIVTRIQQMGGISAGKDYNARILRQNPDAKRVLRTTGGKAPDAIAYQLQAEGWPVSSGDELIELLKSGKGRTIYNPEKADKLFNRDIRRAENVWIEEQLAKNESIPGEVRERIPDHQTRVIDEIGSQGLVEERNLDKALKEVSDFFDEMGGKVKAQTDNVKETSKPAKLGKLQP